MRGGSHRRAAHSPCRIVGQWRGAVLMTDKCRSDARWLGLMLIAASEQLRIVQGRGGCGHAVRALHGTVEHREAPTPVAGLRLREVRVRAILRARTSMHVSTARLEKVARVRSQAAIARVQA